MGNAHLSPIASKLVNYPSLAATISALDKLLAFDPNLPFTIYGRRAALIAGLKTCILTDVPTTYAPIAAAANWHPDHWGHRHVDFHEMLGFLSTETFNGGGALVTAVVVANEDGLPGGAFYDLRAKLRGCRVAKTFHERVAQWHEELVLLGMTPRNPK